MRLKVLPAETWMIDEDSLAECVEASTDDYTSVPTVFRRTGIYLLGKICWFEVPGKAWSYPISMFELKLQRLEAERLNDKQVRALREMVRQKLATKEQRELLRNVDFAREIRESGRRARLHCIQLLGSYHEQD